MIISRRCLDNTNISAFAAFDIVVSVCLCKKVVINIFFVALLEPFYVAFCLTVRLRLIIARNCLDNIVITAFAAFDIVVIVCLCNEVIVIIFFVALLECLKIATAGIFNYSFGMVNNLLGYVVRRVVVRILSWCCLLRAAMTRSIKAIANTGRSYVAETNWLGFLFIFHMG